MEQLINLKEYPVKNVLPKLLQDKTTGKNIIYATDGYLGYGCDDTDQITESALLGFEALDLQPRVMKAQSEQSERTRKKAEVFTPTWIVRQMNDYCANVWGEGKKSFTWKDMVSLRILEITCGEAPFLVTRYDTTTGEPIPIEERTGMLDRKLHTLNECAADEEEWLKWTYKAFESTYGYEFQGDNLLIARINLLVTFCDYLEARWQRKAEDSELRKVCNIIAWNIWQMDGLKDTVPLGIPGDDEGFTGFLFGEEEETPEADDCKIYNHRSGKSMLYKDLKGEMASMKFDFVIGNPPYQDNVADSENKTFMPAVYNLFMDASYEVANHVCLIHPARFLFNAGQTPKAWNEKMLNDEHFKILYYEPDGSKIFSNTEIKGGIVVSYRDDSTKYGAIKIFTKYPELNSIIHKVGEPSSNLSTIMLNQNKFDLDALYKDYPQFQSIIGSSGRDKRFRNNIFDKISLFSESQKDESDIAIIGVVKNKRTWRYFPIKYMDKTHGNLCSWKVAVGAASGSGVFGEAITPPFILEPRQGYTQTYIGVGSFETEGEATNLANYIKTKFLRTLLGVLKITQHNDISTWRMIPLQDFTNNSDIDWSKSIAEIDQQLYAKYSLTPEEIDFIESHVKEME